MKTETTIRRVQPGDEETLAYILTESWKAAFSDILDSDTLTRCTGIEAAIGMFRKLLEEGTGNGYLLFVNGKPHCTAWWDAARDPEFERKAELISIYSLPDEWRKGYGTIMLERVFSDIRAAAYEETVLWVFKENDRAISFYQANGFSLTGHEKMVLGATAVCLLKKF